jgi:hypothetical protein
MRNGKFISSLSAGEEAAEQGEGGKEDFTRSPKDLCAAKWKEAIYRSDHAGRNEES